MSGGGGQRCDCDVINPLTPPPPQDVGHAALDDAVSGDLPGGRDGPEKGRISHWDVKKRLHKPPTKQPIGTQAGTPRGEVREGRGINRNPLDPNDYSRRRITGRAQLTLPKKKQKKLTRR